ncbi:putative sialin-like isoform X1 [Apostichopus japonicus]|uniref:Putative sialin-like isoform X1 n=1 Tax=Stichopus japonicus TaxID=307972 RepID=A0A2G8K9C3_STIJA|nr:putative sialin-like isoform X1 [Apostichopus japonicus]
MIHRAGELDNLIGHWNPVSDPKFLLLRLSVYSNSWKLHQCLLQCKVDARLSVFFSAILNFLTPLAANHGYIFLIGTRVLLGLVQGVYFPAVFHLLGLWLPPRERTSSYSFVAAGTSVGSTVFLFISGVLASSNIMQGWPSVFYFSGIAGTVWCLLWFPLAYNSPSSHPWISESEKEYIMESLKWNKRAKQHHKVPWSSLLLSIPVWSALICQVCSEFGFFVFLAETPTYFSKYHGFNLSQSGFLSGLPWILQPLMGVGVSLIAENIIRAKLARVVVVRKGLSLTVLLFIVTANSNCNTLVAITCFVTAITFGGLYTPGFYVNRLDIAPNSAGVLAGMVNVLTTLGGIAGPLLVALIVGDEDNSSPGTRSLPRPHLSPMKVRQLYWPAMMQRIADEELHDSFK